jgi:hypothetical protein
VAHAEDTLDKVSAKSLEIVGKVISTPCPASRMGSIDRAEGGRKAHRGYNRPMPRVREVEDPGDDPLLKETFAKEIEAFGFVLNTTKIQAHTPGIMRAAKQLARPSSDPAFYAPQLLALIYLRVALINGCPF